MPDLKPNLHDVILGGSNQITWESCVVHSLTVNSRPGEVIIKCHMRPQSLMEISETDRPRTKASPLKSSRYKFHMLWNFVLINCKLESLFAP